WRRRERRRHGPRHRQWPRARGALPAAQAARGLPARGPGAHGHARRLRTRDLRRLHRPAERRGRALLPAAGRAGRRRRDHHSRSPAEGRRPPPAAGGVPRAPRAAVWVLHTRHADDCARPAAREAPAERGRDPRGALRRPLSLHRLPWHREGRTGRCRPDEGWEARMRRKWVVTGVAVLLMLCLVPGAGAQGTIKIGEINSFSGIGAPFTGPYKQAVEMAVEEVNAKGGVLGRKVEVIFRDDKGQPAEAVKAAQELVSGEKVALISGTFLS